MILFLNDIAGSEILLILVFILMFFGSKSIPGIARTFGKTIRQIKDASQDIQDEIKRSGAEMKKDLNLDQLLEQGDNLEKEIREPVEKFSQEIDDTMRYNRSNYFYQRQQELQKKSEGEEVEKNDSPEEGKQADQEKTENKS
ncbi:MAG: twin-arginine translocase TatA/TatE family subunit [Bacteroidetes bacterium]|nr:MAG: twin-arginine translocase TatA/TatE family subunit [Bacteroidota bacterium]